MWLRKSCVQVTGILMRRSVSFPPASNTTTWFRGSALSRSASTEPAEPVPTTT
jgi:hypothetical protein